MQSQWHYPASTKWVEFLSECIRSRPPTFREKAES